MGLVESQIPTGSVTPPPTNILQRQLDCCANTTQGPGTIEEGETEDLRGEGRMQQPSLYRPLCLPHCEHEPSGEGWLLCPEGGAGMPTLNANVGSTASAHLEKLAGIVCGIFRRLSLLTSHGGNLDTTRVFDLAVSDAIFHC